MSDGFGTGHGSGFLEELDLYIGDFHFMLDSKGRVFVSDPTRVIPDSSTGPSPQADIDIEYLIERYLGLKGQ